MCVLGTVNAMRMNGALTVLWFEHAWYSSGKKSKRRDPARGAVFPMFHLRGKERERER